MAKKIGIIIAENVMKNKNKPQEQVDPMEDMKEEGKFLFEQFEKAKGEEKLAMLQALHAFMHRFDEMMMGPEEEE